MRGKKRVIFALAALLFAAGSGLALPRAIAGAEERKATENPISVWLIAGQSNAVGYSLSSQHWGPNTYEDVLYYGITDNVVSTGKATFESVHLGLGVADGGFSAFGPEMGMARTVTEDPYGERYAIIKCAYGGTPFSPSGISSNPTDQSYRYGSWSSPSYLAKHSSSREQAGKCYKNLVTTVEEGLTELKAQGYTPSVTGIAWMQGEQDSYSGVSANTYKELLLDLVSDLQKDVKEIADTLALPQENFPLVAGMIPSSYSSGAANIRKGITDATEESEYVYAVDNDKFTTRDGHHYVGNDMITLGENFANTLLENAPASDGYLTTIACEEGITSTLHSVRGFSGAKVNVPLTIAEGKELKGVTFKRLSGTEIAADTLSYQRTESGFTFILPAFAVKVTVTAAEKQEPPADETPGGEIPEEKPKEEKETNLGLIIGLSVGGGVLVIGGAVAMVLILKKKKGQQ